MMSMIKTVLKFIIALFFIGLAPLQAHADSPEIYTRMRDNLAVSGYDTVSFFSGKPQKGNEEITLEYKGARWNFATRANRDLFRTNPEAFAPAYGGYCAWAVAHDKLAKGSPKHWHVKDGRLFLNFNGRIQRKWDKKRDTFITKADEIWPDILLD